MFGNLENVLNNKYVFEESYLYDGSIDEDKDEDMYLYPNLDTFVILPWRLQWGKVAGLHATFMQMPIYQEF